MNTAVKAPILDVGLFQSPAAAAALIALAGVLVGLVARDIVMASLLARKKRADEVADRKAAELRAHRDLVRLYSDPLKEAVRSLRFRLHEIIGKKQGQYLLSGALGTPYLTYKKISTLYRIAALLGWIRAIRRERSYLDPEQASASSEMQAITDLEFALADGDHVEQQRLDELLNLWRVTSIGSAVVSRVGNLIDQERAQYLAHKGALVARDLSADEQVELAERCAQLVRHHASVDIPPELVTATASQAAIVFGIKEAYIYRDWQAAIGDLMLEDNKAGPRHFSVLGFGAFEDLYMEAQQKKKRVGLARWFERLAALIHDLDMEAEGMFDARRAQLRKVYSCCIELEERLDERTKSATGKTS